MASLNLMITKKIESSKPLTLRQRIRELQDTLQEAQDVYVNERLNEVKLHPMSLRNLRAIVEDASKMDINEHGERVFYYGTRRQWTDTKI